MHPLTLAAKNAVPISGPRPGTPRPRRLRALALLAMASAVLPAGLPAQRLVRESLAQWRAALPAVVDIAATDRAGEVVLELPVAATRLADGRIVVADGPAGRVRFFTPAGTLQRTVGRSGRGPGEFVAISWLGRCAADSVFAWDFAQQRLSVITAQGEIVRQTRIPTDPSQAPPPASLACSRNGVMALVGWSTQSAPAGATSARGTAPLTVLTTAGGVLHRLGNVAGPELAVLDGAPVAPRPLGKATLVAVSSEHLFVATGDSAWLDAYALGTPKGGVALSGMPRRAWPVGGQRRTPSRRHLALAVDPLVAFFPVGALRDQMRQQLLDLPPPAAAPPYSALFVDSANTLWVQTSIAGDPETRLEALGPDGRARGSLVLPPDLTIFEVGTDYVLGRYDTPAGEAHVVVYRFARGR